jgi:flagella basal body P-ring formation protein FlgA
MRRLPGLLAALLLTTLCQVSLAADSLAIRRAVEDYLQARVRDLPGPPVPVIGRIDAERLPGTCEDLTVAMNGTRRWGTTQVVVTCRGASGKLYVQVEIPVVAEYIVAARPIGAGQKVTEGDIATRVGKLPNEAVIDRDQVIGRVAKNSMGNGVALRADMLRQPWVVQQGQTVKIVVVGRGFEVTKEGRALHNAAVGQDTQVRLDSATIVNGVARGDGSIEVRN